MMRVEPFRSADIGPFLKLAVAEGWVAEPWELEFLLADFPQGSFTAYADYGEAAESEMAGFVTSLRHRRSGWIGNLVVAERFRGRGIGTALFRSALEVLRMNGAQTIWLTASKSGAPLYEKYGFRRIDTVVRRVGAGRQRHGMNTRQSNWKESGAVACGIDCQGWGDRRDALLAVTVSRGRLLREESGFAAIQPCGDGWQLGPYSALDSGTSERLLDVALRSLPPGAKIFVDSPASNRAAQRMFSRKKMRISGTTELMYAGMRPDYRPELIYGSATMGSCG